MIVPSDPRSFGRGFEKFDKGWRPLQKETVEELLKSDKKFLLLEGPTGSGKTLIASSFHKAKENWGTVYSCTTKDLQKQYMNDVEPFAACLMGRSNYECILLSDEKDTVYCDKCIEGSEYECEYKKECEYRRKVREAEAAELAVLNIWSLLNQVKFPKRFTGRKILVLDEADTLEEGLIGFARRKITKRMCNSYTLPVPDFTEVDMNYWKNWLEESLKFIEYRINHEKNKKEKEKLKSFKVNTLQYLWDSITDGWVLETSKTGKEEISFVPVDVKTLAHELLFQHFDQTLLMSASFCGDRLYTEIMGIKDYDYVKLPSYFKSEKSPIYFIPIANVNRNNAEDSYREVVKAIDHILDKLPNYQTIVHTVSNKYAEMLIKQSHHEVSLYNSTDGKVNLEAFRMGLIPILASPSLERGYDFPGDACRINVISKVPYPYLGSESVQARKKAHPRWYSWQTVQKLVQMTGRSTRSQDDYSLSFILDTEMVRVVSLSKDLFPGWWKKKFKQIELEDVSEKLMEEARNGR